MGSKRAGNYVGSTRLFAGQTEPFVPQESLGKNKWTLGGKWSVESEKITAESSAVLRINISAKEVYVVASSESQQQMAISLNNQPISQTTFAGKDVIDSRVPIKNAQLYRLVKFSEFRQNQLLELQVPSGVSINVFTFGS
jgi:alpha-L-arabinofuranosidase